MDDSAVPNQARRAGTLTPGDFLTVETVGPYLALRGLVAEDAFAALYPASVTGAAMITDGGLTAR